MITMRLWITLLFVGFYFGACAQPATRPNGQTGEYVFVSVNVVPMDRDTVLQNQTVHVINGIISYVGDDKTLKYSKAAKLIDGKGKYLMPGLAEMHAHVPPVDDLEPMKEVLQLFLANGITTIRGMLGHPMHLVLKEKIASGEILGPAFYTSGPSANGNTAATPEAAIQLVKNQKKAGYDFIKIHPGIQLESFKALATNAKELQLPFAGHVPSDVGIWNAIASGLQTIDHLDGMFEALMLGKERFAEGAHGLFGIFAFEEADTSRIDLLMEALLTNKTWVVPTQALAVRWLSPIQSAAQRSSEAEMQYMDKTTIANWIKAKENTENSSQYKRETMDRYIQLRNKLIKSCQEKGVPLLLGSDAPQVFNVPGFSLHHELQYLVDAGLTPYEALSTGTKNVGKFYKQPGMGVIQKGSRGDLVLLDANPLQSIENTKSIQGVMVGGKWLDAEWRNRTLSFIRARHD